MNWDLTGTCHFRSAPTANKTDIKSKATRQTTQSCHLTILYAHGNPVGAGFSVAGQLMPGEQVAGVKGAGFELLGQFRMVLHQ